jgi:hypothetical protein
MVLVVGEVAGAETERGELNDSLRGGKGGALEKFGGGPSKLIKGVLSCDSGLIVWRGE